MGIIGVKPLSRAPRVKMPALSVQEKLGIAVVALMCLWVLYITWRAYGTMPETIPVRYDMHGVACGFGSKKTLWIPPILMLLISASFGLGMRFPWLGNYGGVTVTERNAVAIYSMARRMFLLTNVMCAAMFCYLTNVLIAGEKQIDLMAMYGFVAAEILIVVFYMVKIIRHSRTTEGNGENQPIN